MSTQGGWVVKNGVNFVYVVFGRPLIYLEMSAQFPKSGKLCSLLGLLILTPLI